MYFKKDKSVLFYFKFLLEMETYLEIVHIVAIMTPVHEACLKKNSPLSNSEMLEDNVFTTIHRVLTTEC